MKNWFIKEESLYDNSVKYLNNALANTNSLLYNLSKILIILSNSRKLHNNPQYIKICATRGLVSIYQQLVDEIVANRQSPTFFAQICSGKVWHWQMAKMGRFVDGEIGET